jgi:hypothetical protein
LIRALLVASLLLGCDDKKKTEVDAEPAPLKMEPQDTAPAAAPDTAPADTYVAPEDTAVADTGPPSKGPHKKLNIKPPIISK